MSGRGGSDYESCARCGSTVAWDDCATCEACGDLTMACTTRPPRAEAARLSPATSRHRTQTRPSAPTDDRADPRRSRHHLRETRWPPTEPENLDGLLGTPIWVRRRPTKRRLARIAALNEREKS